MKRSRFTEEQIVGVLREQEAGARIEEVCRCHGISSATLYKWKSKYGGFEISDARRLRAQSKDSDRAKHSELARDHVDCNFRVCGVSKPTFATRLPVDKG
jgi:putative transposase